MRGAAATFLRAGLALVAFAALAAASGQADPLVGTFGDGRLTLVLQATGPGQYGGSLRLDAQTFPLTAAGSPQRLDGRFDAPGGAFTFTASLAGDVVTLVSGASTYRLQRQAATPVPPEASSPAPAAAGALVPGTQVSYEFAVVSHPGTATAPQRFEVRPDGTSVPVESNEVRGSGATGVTQYEIVHLDERLCVMQSVDLLRPELGAALVPNPFSSTSVVVSRDGTCAEVWWPPARLQAYTAPPDGTQRVDRGPFQLQPGGATVDALFVRQELAGTRFSRVWDLASGLLLAYTDGTGPTPAPAREPTSSSTATLVAARVIERPWDARQALTGTVRELNQLRYRVTMTTAFVGIASPPHVQSGEVTYVVAERHPTFLLLRVQGGDPNAFALLATNGSLYLPPAAVATLHPGQLIDEDPVIGASVRVARADAGGVVLETRAATFAGRSTYDPASGLLTSDRLEYGDGITTTTLELELLDAR